MEGVCFGYTAGAAISLRQVYGPRRKAPDPEAAQEGENPDAITALTSLSGPQMPGRREEGPGNEQVQGA